jgi:nitrate reductase / nitrite oxidoreductase, alpha subunit
MEALGVDPALDGKWKVKLVDGSEVEVQTAWTLYRVHLRDYDTASPSPRSPIRRRR